MARSNSRTTWRETCLALGRPWSAFSPDPRSLARRPPSSRGSQQRRRGGDRAGLSEHLNASVAPLAVRRARALTAAVTASRVRPASGCRHRVRPCCTSTRGLPRWLRRRRPVASEGPASRARGVQPLPRGGCGTKRQRRGAPSQSLKRGASARMWGAGAPRRAASAANARGAVGASPSTRGLAGRPPLRSSRGRPRSRPRREP